MGHSLNNGLLTHTRGCILDAYTVTFAAAGVPTLVTNDKSGLLSVARTAQGRYTFTITSPIPPKLVAVVPNSLLTSVTGGLSALRYARYVEGSYNATTGTFEIDVTDATPALQDPVTATSLSFVILFQKNTTI